MFLYKYKELCFNCIRFMREKTRVPIIAFITFQLNNTFTLGSNIYRDNAYNISINYLFTFCR